MLSAVLALENGDGVTALPEVWWEAGREERVTAVSDLLDDDDSADCREATMTRQHYYDQTAPL